MRYIKSLPYIISFCFFMFHFLSSSIGQYTYQDVNLREITFSDTNTITQGNSNSINTDITKIDESRFALTRIDFVPISNGNDDESYVALGSIVDSTIYFSKNKTFNETSYLRRIGTLDTNTLVIISEGPYRVPLATRSSSAILGEIIDDSICFGNNFIFNMGRSYYMDMCILDSEHFVVTYLRGLPPFKNDTVYACLGTVVGDSIQYSSTALVTDSGISDLSICSLDSCHFVIGYIDVESSNGMIRSGSISDDTISLGQKQCFNSGAIYQLSTTAINDSSIFLFHHEMYDTVRGTVAVVHENEIIMGNSSAFKSFGAFGTTATRIDDNHVVVLYSHWPSPDERIGKIRLAAINNTNISFSEEYDYSNCSGATVPGHMIGVNDSEFVISYLHTCNEVSSVSKIGYISPYPVLTIADSGSSCSGFHHVPITEMDLKNINELSLTLEYDTLNLSFFSFQNLNSQLLVDSLNITESNGLINITYRSDIPLNLNHDTLLELVFNIDTVLIHSTEVLEWNDELSFFINNKGDTIGKRFENGYINIMPAVGEAGPIIGQDSICQGTINASYFVEPFLNADFYVWNLEPNIADSIVVFDTVVTIYFQSGNVTPSTLTVYGGNSCGNSDTSSIYIETIENPISIAGSDTTICENSSFQMSGTAYNYHHVYWATLGDGNFDDPFLLNSTYFPGSEDIANGSTSLMLFAFANNPCLGEVGDTLILTITPLPIVDSGSDDSTCIDDPYLLSGISYNYSTVKWTTCGDGEFSDTTQLMTYYYPGPNDIELGSTNLVLTASATYPCDELISDTVVLSIIDIPHQPSTPQGPVVILLDTCSITEYYTDTVENANSYQWHLEPSDAGVITGNGINAIVNWNTSYIGILAYIYVQAINDCGETFSDSLIIDMSTVGLFNENSAYDITVSPNPSNGFYNVSIEGLEGNAELYVANTGGKLIRYETFMITKNEYKYPLDLSDVPSGVYYLRIVFKKQKHFDNMIILRKD